MQTQKIEDQHEILHIRITLGTESQHKTGILSLWIEFLPKEYFLSKTDKMNTTMEFCIVGLV